MKRWTGAIGRGHQCVSARCFYCGRTIICAAPLSKAKTSAFWRDQLTCGYPSCIDLPIWKEGDILHNTLRWIIRRYKTGGQGRHLEKKRAARRSAHSTVT